ncbi:hypothetical protein IGI04_023500, partial [Brassica rapa subsp. trilocularis]
MVRPRYGRSVKGLRLGFRIENRQGQEQLEAVKDRLGAVIAERLQGRGRHLFGYNSHPFGPMAGNLCQNRERQTPKREERTGDPRKEPARGLAVPGETGSWDARPEDMDTRQRDREKDKEKEMAPGERTPKGTLNQGPGRFSIQVLGLWSDCSWSDLDVLDQTWTVVRQMHRKDSGHGKMCGEWIIVDRCEILIAYCATCELMELSGLSPGRARKRLTGLVNEEIGEPLATFLPTEVQVDNLDEQQEEGREEEANSSHAGEKTGPGDGAEELAEPSMREVMDVVKAMGTQMLAFTQAFTSFVNSSVGQMTRAQATVQETQRAARTAGTAA